MTSEHPTPPNETPDGSTNISEERKEYTEALGDGSETDVAAKVEEKDSDTASGGDPE